MNEDHLFSPTSVNTTPDITGRPDSAMLDPTPISDMNFPAESFHVDFSDKYTHRIQWAWHEEVEFFIVYSGKAMMQFPENQEGVLLEEGDAIFINQNRLHTSVSASNGNTTGRTLKFHPNCILSYSETTLCAKFLTPVTSSPDFTYLILKKDDPKSAMLLSLLKEGIQVCTEKEFGYELKAKSILCNIWHQLFSHVQNLSDVSTPTLHQTSMDNIRIKQAMVFIDQKYMEPLTLDDIAASIHVSKSECCRCFQRSLGITPFEYLMKYRIYKSTVKIMSGDSTAKSIATLAASVGFNNTSYYNKIFKKYTDCTPTEYKKKYTKNKNTNSSEI